MRTAKWFDGSTGKWLTLPLEEPDEQKPLSCKRALWYRKEASIWEEALSLGNGILGAMPFCGPLCDRISISQETMWTGSPQKSHATRSLSDLAPVREMLKNGQYMEANQATAKLLTREYADAFTGYGSLNVDTILNSYRGGVAGAANVTGYTRRLDLETGIVTAEYAVGGNQIRKEYFVSMTDNVFVMRVRCQNPISFHIYQSVEPEHSTVTENGVMITQGRCPTGMHPLVYDDRESIRFCSMLKLRCQQDPVYGGSGAWIYTPTQDFTILFALDTSFNGPDQMPVSEGRDCKAGCASILVQADQYSYEQLLSRHTEKFRSYFNRVSLQIQGDNYDHLATDERIVNVSNGVVDNHLVTLLFDFGRYLTITSAANGDQPINLVGIWTDRSIAPFSGDFHLNINAQMNYWPTNTVNLPECQMSFFRMIKDLAAKGNFYGLRGWAAWLSTDIWRNNMEHSPYPNCGMWPFGGAWACRHIWEHYLHTRDLEFLKEYYPLMEGACQFLEDWMVEDADGFLTTAPSVSPENDFVIDGVLNSVVEGSAMDLSICRDIFGKLVLAAKELGLDAHHYENVLNRIKPLEIGRDGRLLEWGQELEEWQLGHRHVSHLYGLYPGDVLTEEQTQAAAKSLKVRLENGGGHTGWSNAWIACLFARLKDGEQVMHYVRNMFRNSIYPNMFDAHPPFQIDGNFGICAAICEALMQSHTGTVELIPAIPNEWKRGEVRGFVSRTGEIINFRWANGKAERF